MFKPKVMVKNVMVANVMHSRMSHDTTQNIFILLKGINSSYLVFKFGDNECENRD